MARQRVVERDTPIRTGAHYCSPGCGRGCLYEEYLRTQTDGEKMGAGMGKNWEPRIWENLGWQVSLDHKTAPVSIHLNGPRNYTCFFYSDTQFLGEGSTPKATLENAIDMAKLHVAIVEKHLKMVTRK